MIRRVHPFVFVVALLGCTGVLRHDVALAMDPAAQWFVNYESDGTAAGDSAVLIAGAAVAEIEDGNEYRGLRLLDEALRRGVPDLAFYRDALGIAHLRLDPALCQLVIRLALERFPEERWDSRQCDRMAGGGA
ncbi:MAG TPA: hypothetical protein VFM71_03625 [Gemmatimonadaceae bacterium]|nr:hypothetical protein [Gemmatimonadaceae bacterium]